MAALRSAEGSYAVGSGAMLGLSDQLNAAAKTAGFWLSTHRCPVPAIDDRMNRMLRS